MLTFHLIIFFGEVSGSDLWPIFNCIVNSLLLSFEDSLYILDNSPLSDSSFANVFSQAVVYLLILLTVSFAEQKF